MHFRQRLSMTTERYSPDLDREGRCSYLEELGYRKPTQTARGEKRRG